MIEVNNNADPTIKLQIELKTALLSNSIYLTQLCKQNLYNID